MNKKVIIANSSEDMKPVLKSVKEFPTERIHILTTRENLIYANKAKEDLEAFDIFTKIHEIKNNVWEDTFRILYEINELEKDSELLVNASTSDYNSRTALTCAAFVNGLKVFTINQDGELIMLPIMKFSYYSLLTDKKMQLLKILNEKEYTAFEELSRLAKMSLPLISYHINGNLKSEGLKMLGLIETKEEGGKTYIKLSTLGLMLLKGYIKS